MTEKKVTEKQPTKENTTETKKCGFWSKIKNIPWKKPVKPAIGYSIFGGTLALAVLIGVLVICL